MPLDDNAKAGSDLLGVVVELLRQCQQPLASSTSRFAPSALSRVESAEVLIRDILKDFLKGAEDEESAAHIINGFGRALEPMTPTNVTPRSTAESELLAKVARAHEAFVLLDTDLSGTLDSTELRVALRHIGVKEDRLDVVLDHVMQKNDPEGIKNGLISLDEFVGLFTDVSDDDTMNFLQQGFKNINEDLVDEFNKRTQGMVTGFDQKILIHPRSQMSTNWDVYVAILLVATIFTMPLSMAFLDIQNTLRSLDYLADVTFVLDMIKHFNTGYVDDFEYTIMDRKKVRWNYLSSWFIPDLLSSVPIEIITLVLGGSGDDSGSVDNFRATKLVKLLRLSRIAKVFRIMKLSKLSKLFRGAQDAFEDYYQVKVDEASLAMGRLFLSLLVLAHWVGCINFMICREYGFPDDSWVVNAELVDADTATQYQWCFFKALISMIGLGFESPPLVNTVCVERSAWCTIEHWVTLVCLYIGSIFYALLISSVSFVMANLDKGGSNLSEKLWGLSEYLRNKKVPVKLKDKVRSFFRLQYSEGKMYENDILDVLPWNLQREIMNHNQQPLFDQVPVLNDETFTPRALLARLAPVLSSQLIFSSEVIFEEDMTGTEMYFISSGIVQIFSKFYEPMIKQISDGCYFGDVACMLGCKRTATLKARTNVALSVLEKKDLLAIMGDYPLVFKRMLRVAEKRRLRLASLDHSKPSLPLTSEQSIDDEDAATKYYVKLTGLVKEQDTVFRASLQRSGSVQGAGPQNRKSGKAQHAPVQAPARGRGNDFTSSFAARMGQLSATKFSPTTKHGDDKEVEMKSEVVTPAPPSQQPSPVRRSSGRSLSWTQSEGESKSTLAPNGVVENAGEVSALPQRQGPSKSLGGLSWTKKRATVAPLNDSTGTATSLLPAINTLPSTSVTGAAGGVDSSTDVTTSFLTL